MKNLYFWNIKILTSKSSLKIYKPRVVMARVNTYINKIISTYYLHTFGLGAFFMTHAVSWHIITLFNIFRFTFFHRGYRFTNGFFPTSWFEANFFSTNTCPTFLCFNFVTTFRNGLAIDFLTNGFLQIKKEVKFNRI